MRFRTRLLSFGIPIIALSISIAATLNAIQVSSALADSRRNLLSSELKLVENRIASDYDTLKKVGLDTDSYFTRNAREAIVRYADTLLGEGEEFLIIDDAGRLLSRSANPYEQPIYPLDDPLRVAFGGTERLLALRSGYFANPGVYIVAKARFEPWKWHLVAAADESALFRSILEATQSTVAVSLISVVAAAVGFALLADRVSRPLASLSALTRELAEGRFDVTERLKTAVPRGSSLEVETLAREFGSMAERISSLTRGLEAKVAERTAELEGSNASLELANEDLSSTIAKLQSAQDQLVISEKMASLGHLVAGIAHELNTPLGAIVSAGSDIARTLSSRLMEVMERYRGLSEGERADFRGIVEGATKNPMGRNHERERRRRLDLRRLLGEHGIEEADELADKIAEMDPEGEIPALERLPTTPSGRALIESAWELSSMHASLGTMLLASEKATKVVKSLKIYSHQDLDEQASVLDLRLEIDTILTLYHNVLKRGVEVTRSYGDVPRVSFRRDKLNQVWMNLINNAAQAMKYQGRIDIDIRADAESVYVSIGDTGPGIPDQVKPKIFTPFFTTKDTGEGTGLGMSICKRIVEGEGGAIDFESEPGRTVFKVRLPLHHGRGEDTR